MKVTVIAKNIDITVALKEMVDRKLKKLDRYFDSSVEARATLSVQKNRQIVEVTIPFNGVILRVEEATDDMYKSIDIVQEKIERQIRKQRTKLSRRNAGNALKYAQVALDFKDSIDEEEDSKVVKTKTFGVKPMSVDEAMLQLELVGHSFFVYQDADTNKVNVMYKRKDGNYGLLEPDYI